MSFFAWFLRATLVLSFVLGSGAHAGTAFDVSPVAAHRVALAAQRAQADCNDEQASGASGHSAHHMAAATTAPGDTTHDAASGCCKVMNDCHCAGSHCVSCVATPMAQTHGPQRQEATLFSRSAYGSPALALSIKPPIA